jgi:hypothetical protein
MTNLRTVPLVSTLAVAVSPAVARADPDAPPSDPHCRIPGGSRTRMSGENPALLKTGGWAAFARTLRRAVSPSEARASNRDGAAPTQVGVAGQLVVLTASMRQRRPHPVPCSPAEPGRSRDEAAIPRELGRGREDRGAALESETKITPPPASADANTRPFALASTASNTSMRMYHTVLPFLSSSAMGRRRCLAPCRSRGRS